MPSGFRGRRYGDLHGIADIAQGTRAGVRKSMEDLMTREPCVVQSYDSEAQRVAVRLKNFPEWPVISGVPVKGTGGRWRTLTPIAAGEVGILEFFRSDSTASFDNQAIQPLRTTVMHMGRGATYSHGPLLTDDAALPASLLTLITEAGVDVSKVAGLFDAETGAAMFITTDGDLILRGRKVYLLELDGTIAASKEVAFNGSTVGGGVVTSGSPNVKVS